MKLASILLLYPFFLHLVAMLLESSFRIKPLYVVTPCKRAQVRYLALTRVPGLRQALTRVYRLFWSVLVAFIRRKNGRDGSRVLNQPPLLATEITSGRALPLLYALVAR